MLAAMTREQMDEWIAAAKLDNLLCDPYTGRGLPTPDTGKPDTEKAVSPNQAAQFVKALAGH